MKARWIASLAAVAAVMAVAFLAVEPVSAAERGIIQVRATGTVTAAPDTLELRLVVRPRSARSWKKRWRR